MKLTSDYRRVTALFNTPPEQEVEYEEDFINYEVKTRFTVGPFTYVMQFYPDENQESTVRVDFKLVDIKAVGSELTQMMSKAKKKLMEEGEIPKEAEGQPMSWDEVRVLRNDLLTKYRYHALEIAGPYAIRVFGTVLNIIKGYVENHRGSRDCLVFSADPESRARIYLRMIQSAFPGARVQVGPDPLGSGTEITVCFT
jgi:hypothetical protein